MARRDTLPVHPLPEDQRLPNGEPGALWLSGLCARPGTLSAAELELKQAGVTFKQELQTAPSGNLRLAFIADPDGFEIELTERA